VAAASQPETSPVPFVLRSSWRRLLEIGVLVLTGLLLFRAVGAEPYSVPTGSMAPALLGDHKAITCPHCGYPVRVGCGESAPETPRLPACPNCGSLDLDFDSVPVCSGDHVLVNKNIFDWRRPRRWEMAVFRCPVEPERAFVKRVVGLPGESVQVRGGDVYVDHDLARKTLAEFKAVRIPVFDQTHTPVPEGWQGRWETQPGGSALLEGSRLVLRSAESGDDYRWLIYRHCRLDEYKARAVTDEYSYNGLDHGRAEPVHDFQMECDLEVLGGSGRVALEITDGQDTLQAELPVGPLNGGTRLRDASRADVIYRTGPGFGLKPGRKYHVELAFVDRRATLVVDGVCPFAAVDRPPAEWRAEVARPVRLGAQGVDVRVHNFRLFRDIHYTDAGPHGSRAAVRLGAGEYFVLGDNSPNSDDNRFWSGPDGQAVPVPERNFLGKPFLIHMPSRVVHCDVLGGHWVFLGLDWGRIRWLH
jgi:signal peptidase I